MCSSAALTWMSPFVVTLLLATACGPSVPPADGGTDAGPVGGRDSGTSDDAGTNEDAGTQDAGPSSAEIAGDPQVRASCSATCADAGYECDPLKEWGYMGTGGGKFEYGPCSVIASCTDEPPATDWCGNTDAQLTSYSCGCKRP